MTDSKKSLQAISLGKIELTGICEPSDAVEFGFDIMNELASVLK
jgi:hypothetical protein